MGQIKEGFQGKISKYAQENVHDAQFLVHVVLVDVVNDFRSFNLIQYIVVVGLSEKCKIALIMHHLKLKVCNQTSSANFFSLKVEHEFWCYLAKESNILMVPYPRPLGRGRGERAG